MCKLNLEPASIKVQNAMGYNGDLTDKEQAE